MNDETFLHIERRFDVLPETVFDALTVPEKMRVWWGDNAEFEIDLKERGHWKITRYEGNAKYVAVGQYLAVERPSRLEYTCGMPQFSSNTDVIKIHIKTDRGGCLVTFDQYGEDIASELKALRPGETSGSEAGWQQGFDLMAAAWSEST
ncbi:MAG: SRPBCC domain-containing protein [Leptolyngbya sp. SIO1D8]|nr:SRPBCC domain-containing protein [Leptolyngbya sp. SIO1D8]